MEPRSISSAAAWSAIVEHAIAQRVDVVALSGDVVDQTNGYYEAFGPLERGLRRLRDAGIEVVAVAGNHDHAVLPEIARALGDDVLRLLGRGGQWQRHTIERGGERLHVDGWSFGAPHVHVDPLDAYTLPPATDAPVLGLLHADLDQSRSPYAPVELARLQQTPVSMWLLGHVHQPCQHAHPGRPPVLYPGTPNPLDPSEPGVHGVWCVELAPGIVASPELQPLARVRYDQVEVDLEGVEQMEDVRHRLMLAVQRAAADWAVEPLRHLSLRLRLSGRTPLHRALDVEVQRLREDLEREANGVRVYVERVDVSTRPPRELHALAQGSDAVAVLARLVQALEGGGDVPAEFAELLCEVEAIPGTLAAAPAYGTLPPVPDDPSAGSMRPELARQAALLLDTLLAQREEAA